VPQHSRAVARHLFTELEVTAGANLDQESLKRAAALLERALAEILAVKPEQVEGIIDGLWSSLVALTSGDHKQNPARQGSPPDGVPRGRAGRWAQTLNLV
jgi:hypothetical protein